MTTERGTSGKNPPTAYADFDDFLRAKGFEADIKIAVEKRIIALQLEAERKSFGISKSELARRVGTSRAQIDRILDPRSQNVTIESLKRVAAVMGKRLHFELID
jgi:antitoxin HicB